MKKVLNIIEKVIVCLLLFMILINVCSLISLNISKKGYVNILGYSYFEIASDSMSPVLKKDDIIIIKLSNNFKVNDIVTYSDSGYFVTHRVIEKTSDHFIPKGDNNNTDDGEITSDHVIGVYKENLNWIGYFIKLMRNQYIIIGILILFITIDIVGRKLKDEKKGTCNS